MVRAQRCFERLEETQAVNGDEAGQDECWRYCFCVVHEVDHRNDVAYVEEHTHA